MFFLGPHVHKSTYALAFLTAPYVMIFMRADVLLGPFEGAVLKNLDFFGPKIALASLCMGLSENRVHT